MPTSVSIKDASNNVQTVATNDAVVNAVNTLIAANHTDLAAILAKQPNLSITWTQTTVTLAAATSTTLVATNASRRGLRWMVTGSNPMTVVPGSGPAVANIGMNYNGSAGSGQQGGSTSFADELSQQTFTAISTAGTTVTVWEGI